MAMSERNGLIVATFPVKDDQDIMLVSDGGQIIRSPVKDVRIAGRMTQGVTIFRVDAAEKVVSVTALTETGDAASEGEAEVAEETAPVEPQA
jgi:DNA gyrase subunit A